MALAIFGISRKHAHPPLRGPALALTGLSCAFLGAIDPEPAKSAGASANPFSCFGAGRGRSHHRGRKLQPPVLHFPEIPDRPHSIAPQGMRTRPTQAPSPSPQTLRTDPRAASPCLPRVSPPPGALPLCRVPRVPPSALSFFCHARRPVSSAEPSRVTWKRT